ncbi:MAG TPA: CaiB/BaiF CoA-transferase family protein [Pseudonocardia sp.]
MRVGPLSGVRVLEIAGIGPAPFCAMMLSDLGAEVIRIDRIPAADAGTTAASGVGTLSDGILGRGRRSVALDLKSPEGVALVLDLVADSDALIEGFRPGVLERLGIGPDECLRRNPKLVYGRLTGWGQEGPYAQAAGHDLNYIALAGALAPIGRRGERPVPPLNLIGDFAGGGMLLATGITAALVEAGRSGQGQVVDAAMVDGSAYLMTMMYELLGRGGWVQERGSNPNDGGAHFYDVYETADGEHVSVAAMEPRFYAELLDRIGLAAEDLPAQWDPASWPELSARLAEVFRTRTRAQWCELLEGTNACFAPVLRMSEAIEHPHNVHRGTFTTVAGVPQPAPAPRFSRTPGAVARPAARAGEHTDEVLAEHGVSAERIDALRRSGAVG